MCLPHSGDISHEACPHEARHKGAVLEEGARHIRSFDYIKTRNHGCGSDAVLLFSDRIAFDLRCVHIQGQPV